MAETTKMILIVGKNEDGDLVIAGAYDYLIADVVGAEEYDEAIDKMKRNFDPDLGWYDWREVIVNVPNDELAKYFQTPEITATVEGLDPLAETLRGDHDQLD